MKTLQIRYSRRGGGLGLLRSKAFHLTGTGLAVSVLMILFLRAAQVRAADTTVVETRRLLPSNIQAGHKVGTVAVNETGDLVIVGNSQDVRGAVFIFERNLGGAGAWQERKMMRSPDQLIYDRFGWAPEISGDILAVNTRPNGGLARTTGTVYLYQRHRGGMDNWGLVTRHTGSGDDRFGLAIDVLGDVLVVGAPWDDQAGNDAGACYVYSRDHGGTDNWGLVTKMFSPDAGAGQEFGHWPRLSGDTLVVSEAFDSNSGGMSPGVFVYQRVEGGVNPFELVRKITPSVAGLYDVENSPVGPPVAIDGDLMVVGTSWDDTIQVNVGAAFIYERNAGGPGNWGRVKKVFPSQPSLSLRFGSRVAAYADMVAVSAFGTTGDRKPGAVYLFKRDMGGEDNWGEVARIVPSDASLDDDAFGCCRTAFRNGLLVVPSFWDDAYGVDSGSVFLFQVFDLPRLMMTPDSQGASVTWSEDPGVSFLLEHSTSALGAPWEPVPGGDSSPVRVMTDGSAGFYRLRAILP